MSNGVFLQGKTIVMTGALGAIAEAIVKTLKKAGATLILTDLLPESEAQLRLQEWEVAAFYYSMDITNPMAVSTICNKIFTNHPDIQVALGHAGGTTIRAFAETNATDFQSIIDFNFTGQCHFAREILHHWSKTKCQGHLIFTSSYVSRIPMAGIAAYSSAKAALEMLTKSLALEYAPRNIRVNCIAPGNVAAGSSLLLYNSDPVYKDWVDRISPLGKRNSAQGIANSFLFLCSDLADEIDGQILQVDMGVGLPKLG